VSSLSKAVIISQPGEGVDQLCEPWKGVEWADDGRRGDLKWDVVYRYVVPSPQTMRRAKV
jgi:hypothetical protein